eukprot:3937954-Rhodomonas_salina.1
MFDVVDQHEALRAGKEPLNGAVLTMIKTKEGFNRVWKEVKKVDRVVGGYGLYQDPIIEFSENGEIKATVGLVCDVILWWEFDLVNWIDYVQERAAYLRKVDGRDKSSLAKTFA